MATKVVISVGHGSGLSTWATSGFEAAIATDGGLISLVEGGAAPAAIAAYLEEKFGDDVYISETLENIKNLRVVEIPSGKYWRIVDYDGAESVEIFDPAAWWGIG